MMLSSMKIKMELHHAPFFKWLYPSRFGWLLGTTFRM